MVKLNITFFITLNIFYEFAIQMTTCLIKYIGFLIYLVS